MAQSAAMAPIAEGQSVPLKQVKMNTRMLQMGYYGYNGGWCPTSTLQGSLSRGAMSQCPWAQEAVAGAIEGFFGCT